MLKGSKYLAENVSNGTNQNLMLNKYIARDRNYVILFQIIVQPMKLTCIG
jgi:hypothetical protein